MEEIKKLPLASQESTVIKGKRERITRHGGESNHDTITYSPNHLMTTGAMPYCSIAITDRAADFKRFQNYRDN